MSISGIGYDPNRFNDLGRSGQVGPAKSIGPTEDSAIGKSAVGPETNSLNDRSTLSPEEAEKGDGANQLLAAWGAKAPAQPPPLAIQGVNPGPQSGFCLCGDKLGGMEPGMQAGQVLLSPSRN